MNGLIFPHPWNSPLDGPNLQFTGYFLGRALLSQDSVGFSPAAVCHLRSVNEILTSPAQRQSEHREPHSEMAVSACSCIVSPHL